MWSLLCRRPEQVNAVVGGGNQSVSVELHDRRRQCRDEFALTTDLASLPTGVDQRCREFSCAIVSQVTDASYRSTYAPTASARGTLTLNYSYTDGSGAMRTGALNIPYSPSSHNDVVATASPSGQINAVEKSGGRAVAVTFTTDDGKPATGLYLTTDLAALPPAGAALPRVLRAPASAPATVASCT